MSVDALNIALAICTWAVVAGVMLEGAEHARDVLVSGWPREWHKRLEKIGFVVLVIGLGGEWYFQSAIGQYEDGLIESQQRQIISLQERLAARSLSSSDAAAITKKLGRFSGQDFEVVEYWDDKESVDIGEQIASALDSAGWSRTPVSRNTVNVTVIAGAVVYVDDTASEPAKDAARALVGMLNAENIAAVQRVSQNRPGTDRISVTVGIKP
jgi:hypothetical protein